ncbi:MAG: AmmeMemoRadiSam system radical SAM enzyme [Chloroflexi bacterium]|jgi:pyruvate formate lyase activating enzyme|nr:AmmeMemoRadiSam system radical SAM enzyme [Chloroflexota bacterium]MBT7079990.1 AmmeMemoRadiSam system radical SAM enzyme [Chloroflexota bacterium]MBT7290573.1 AmmeMemoRadiSam system radical SAM enzyme [Chloroflexota bacterium]
MQKEAMLYTALANNNVHCYLCAHQCKIAPSKYGVCGVRHNVDGVLQTLVYNKAIAANVDPIEKKPLYHFLPGSKSYSIATAGCNFKCGFCQNWNISQLPIENRDTIPGQELTPQQIMNEAKETGCASISYTYTEPTIFFEYAYDTAKLARQAGLYNVFVTNGFMTKEAIDTIHPYLDAANVDLKSFSDDYYKKHCKTKLAPVLESIKYMKQLGIWVEVTTLVIPGLNDSDVELNDIAEFLAQVDVDIPWHISRFHPDYRFADYSATPTETLERAKATGVTRGLHHVYLGNVSSDSDTYCPNCKQQLVRRSHLTSDVTAIIDGKCASCGAAIPGVW